MLEFEALRPTPRRIRARAAAMFLCLAALTYVQPARAGLSLSLTSDAPDPNQISAGETIHVKIDLAGLLSGDELVSLSQRFEIDPAIFEVIQVSPGPIAPDPIDDPLDLTLLTGEGFADVTFLTLSGESFERITSNGMFVDIELKALAAGTAIAQVVFTDALQIDPLDPHNLITPEIQVGAALVLRVVPESSSLALAVAGIAATLCSRKFFLP